MEEKAANGLREQQIRRKRINKLKRSILVFTGFWMLMLTGVMAVLLVKLLFLEERMDELAESIISVEHYVENQNARNAGLQEEKSSNTTLENTSEAGEGGAFTEGSPDTDTTDGDVSARNLSFSENLYQEGDQRKVYLTFDDGPSVNTSKILDILKERNIKATFFFIGNEDEESKALYRRIVAEGHTLGMHSFTHKYDVIYQSLDSYIEDLKSLQSYLEEVTGVTTKLIRFPGGSSNKVSNVDMREVIRYVKEQGFTYFDWNVASGDATSQAYTSDELVQNVMNDVVTYKTSVVLMHDSSAKSATVESLEPMIDQLEALGAEILPIDESTTLIQHITENSVE